MCGITGILNFKGKPAGRSLIQSMTDAVAHRGPDADGFFIDNEIALGHRRLSIIDLSEAANQPFIDNSGRYVMVFNGEMYNYQEVRRRLSEYEFRTNGDSEVLLAAYIKWGAECIKYFRGMFAFAIWDKQECELLVCRDRMGIKPLYYYLDEEKFLFSSECRSILASGLVKKRISFKALVEYLSFQSVSYPYSMIEGIMQLEAGSWIRLRKGTLEKKIYWDLTSNIPDFDFEDTKQVQNRIRNLMFQSVERRLVSDVPVAAFLSGGIDSSAVVGLMAETGRNKPDTYTISFEEKGFDESVYAALIAKKFNTNHTEILLRPSVLLEELRNALDAMDSPTGDGINTYIVSKAIREQGIKVALSGIGGDELFAGYPIFSQYLKIQQRSWLWRTPSFLRSLFAMGIISKGANDRMSRLRQLLRLDSCSIENVYPLFRQILSPTQIKEFLSLPGRSETMSSLQKELYLKKKNLDQLSLLSQVSAAEYLGYTQHTLLKDTDQMSMAHSLELREPFFDQDLVEFVLAVSDTQKRPSYPKSLLVESIKPLLPDEIVQRKKQGFLFPWKFWMKNDLKGFCDNNIKHLSMRPFIHGAALKAYWNRFLSGDERVRWAELWLFVVLEYWMEKNGVD